MIDVLVPYYGSPGLMREAVQSVLDQTSADWRLVVVDDCHPDPEIGRWLEALAHPRVDYHRNPTTLGVHGNFSRALSLANSDHVVFLGCDDLLEPTYAETVGRALERHPTTAVVAPQARVIDSRGVEARPLGDRVKRAISTKVDRPTPFSGEAALVSLLRGNWLYFPGLCWRRDLVASIGFRPEYGVVLDLALVVDVLLEGGEILLLPDVLLAYRRHALSESSVTAVNGARFDEERAFFRETERRLLAAGMPQAARAAHRHVTSRLHAGTLLPGALRRRDWPSVHALARHVAR